MLSLNEFIATPGWIDNDRLLQWDDSTESFFVFNLATQSAAYVDSPVTESNIIIGIHEGTTVFFSQQELHSDLWLVELDTPDRDAAPN